VTCQCGKQFHVKDEHAGKRTTCPVCKQPLHIPGSRTATFPPAERPSLAPLGGRSAPPESGSKSFRIKLLVLAAAGGCLLLVALLVVILVLSGSHSPSQALKATLVYANEGRYSEANNGLSAELRSIQDKTGMAKRLWDTLTRNGSITEVEILREEVRGEGA